MGGWLARRPSRRSPVPAGLFLSAPPSHPKSFPNPFCIAIILYYTLALFPYPGQPKHARETQNHTLEDGTLFLFSSLFSFFLFSLLFLPLPLRGASSLVYIAASGAPDPGRKACTEPPTPTPDCEYCTNPTLETGTHTRGAATGVGHGHAPTRTRRRTGGGGGAPPSGAAVRGILCLLKSLYVHADNPESLCTTKSRLKTPSRNLCLGLLSFTAPLRSGRTSAPGTSRRVRGWGGRPRPRDWECGAAGRAGIAAPPPCPPRLLLLCPGVMGGLRSLGSSSGGQLNRGECDCTSEVRSRRESGGQNARDTAPNRHCYSSCPLL